MTILPLVKGMVVVQTRLCRCAGCMGLTECEDLESALQLTMPQGRVSDLHQGYVELEMHTKRKGKAKECSEREVGGHTESEKGTEKERRGEKERIARSERSRKGERGNIK